MNKMRDDQEFNIQFVQLIKNEPCLYDRTLPEYRNKDEHEKIWLKIAREVNENVSHCKERWRNLRACLTRHLKNKQQHDMDSSVHHKPYYLAEHMEFLLPFTKSRGPKEKAMCVDLGNLVNFKEESGFQIDSEIEPVQNSAMIIQNSNTPEDVVTDNEPKKRENINLEISNETSTNTKRIRLTNESLDPKEIEDADLNFFRSLLPDIKQMSTSQKRKFKMGIFQLINDILDNSE